MAARRRRRLFQPLSDEAIADRDATAEAFGRLYRSQRSDFPAECTEIAHEARVKAAYPIHPEVFDRLYQDWSAIDRDTPHLGTLHATRRVARTIFVGATPNVGAANQGLAVRRVRLGSTFAGDKPGPISDALNRLAAAAPHLYVDRDRYWFDRQQNVTRTARDDAERLLAGDRHEVPDEIVKRIKAERGANEFASVHYAPTGGADVADDQRARLVVLEPDAAHIAKSSESPALASAREILNYRGVSPRQYRNMLVFAAADQRGWPSRGSTTAPTN